MSQRLLLNSLRQRFQQRMREYAVQRVDSLRAIGQNKPLNAESDLERKLERIAYAAQVSQRDAEAIARYVAPKSLNLEYAQLIGAERIRGSRDFVDVAFLEQATASAGTVARISFRSGAAVGSGFLISDQLLITNHHVIQSDLMSRSMVAEFDFELDTNRQPKPLTRFEFAPQKCFVSDPTDDLDYTVICVGERISGQRSLREFGFSPLLEAIDKHSLGEYVNIVQHPGGDFKQVVLRENRLVSRGQHVLHYVADTQQGSSGSPVFNDQWEAIALHHFGEPHRETVDPDGKPVEMEVNEGIRISSIVAELRSKATSQDPDARQMIQSALNATHTPGVERISSLISNNVGSNHYTHLPREANGRMTWTVPVEITVGLGGRLASSVGTQTEQSTNPVTVQKVARRNRVVSPRRSRKTSGSEKTIIDRDYTNRPGYSADHLPDHVVPLPRMLKTLHRKAAKLLEPEDEIELKYQHFSIVVHQTRRMAIYTAVNIDGGSWLNMVRKTGRPTGFAEAGEKWFADPRLDAEHQTEQSLCDNQSLELATRVFDRVHLVRRQDPTWGSQNTAIRANADTFHFTNCVPQHFSFDQRIAHWQVLERYVLERAKVDRVPISVFTGPIFDSTDPEFRGIRVPLRFWKILARVENGRLLSTAFVADQSRVVMSQFGDTESDSDQHLEDVAHFQVSIGEIEELTGLRFDALEKFDTIDAAAAEAMNGRIPVVTPEDIRWE